MSFRASGQPAQYVPKWECGNGLVTTQAPLWQYGNGGIDHSVMQTYQTGFVMTEGRAYCQAIVVILGSKERTRYPDGQWITAT